MEIYRGRKLRWAKKGVFALKGGGAKIRWTKIEWRKIWDRRNLKRVAEVQEMHNFRISQES